MERTRSVDEYIARHSEYSAELARLREILQSTELTETVKWGGPCYTCDGKNVVGIGAFKSYFGLWFHQGALLADDKKVLINAQEGKTRALRQWRMASARDIKPSIIKRYVKEAIELVRAGQEIKPVRKTTLTIPDELDAALARQKRCAKAWGELTPGRQREYAEYISEAKREATRLGRLEKILPMIEEGIGLNDRYRNC